MALHSSPERRLHPRISANARAIVVAPGLEIAAVILDASSGGVRLRTNRQMALPPRVLVVDIAAGTALEADVAWRKGSEAGLKLIGMTALRGLVPARLVPAREAWRRAGGR